MSVDLQGRNFLKLLDFTPAEALYLLDLAAQLKEEKRTRSETRRLEGLNFALIFEKGSTRTRCAFEVAASQQGAHAVYLGPTGTQIGVKETMKDTARVLGRMFDGIEYRGICGVARPAGTPRQGVSEYDGRHHSDMRRALNPHVSPSAVEALRPRMEELCTEFIDG